MAAYLKPLQDYIHTIEKKLALGDATEVEFQPTHKLWISGNHKPAIPDTSLAIWRRIKPIPFTVTIPDKDIDVDLSLKLEAELFGHIGLGY